MKNPFKKFIDLDRDPDSPPDRHQNLINCCLGHTPTLQKFSPNSVHKVLSNLADRQTDKQTNRNKTQCKETVLLHSRNVKTANSQISSKFPRFLKVYFWRCGITSNNLKIGKSKLVVVVVVLVSSSSSSSGSRSRNSVDSSTIEVAYRYAIL